MGEKKVRYFYLTLIQVVSAFAVVTAHTNGCYFAFSRLPYWRSANIINALVYFGVPLFLMVTGITLIDYPKRYSLKDFFIKRIEKTVLPFLVWSLAGLIYRICIGTIETRGLKYATIVKMILNGEIVSYYWYFPTLFCIYLCMPLFAAVPKERRQSLFRYLFIAGLVLNNIIPFLKTVFKLDIAISLSVCVVSGHLIYVVGGVLLHENPPKHSVRYVIYALGLAGLLVEIIGTYKLSTERGELITTFKGYNNLPVIAYSFAVFTLLREIGTRIENGSVVRMINAFGRYTFPMYLMHWFILDFAKHTLSMDVTRWLYRGGMILVVPLVVIIATDLLRGIPGIRWIVP